jgi:hypothetical protein
MESGFQLQFRLSLGCGQPGATFTASRGGQICSFALSR